MMAEFESKVAAEEERLFAIICSMRGKARPLFADATRHKSSRLDRIRAKLETGHLPPPEESLVLWELNRWGLSRVVDFNGKWASVSLASFRQQIPSVTSRIRLDIYGLNYFFELDGSKGYIWHRVRSESGESSVSPSILTILPR